MTTIFILKGELPNLLSAKAKLTRQVGISVKTIYELGGEHRMMVGGVANYKELKDAIQDKKIRIDRHIPGGMVECSECGGIGKVVYSCCGYDITFNDFDNCPSCGEHCGDTDPDGDQAEDCPICEGVGIIPEFVKS